MATRNLRSFVLVLLALFSATRLLSTAPHQDAAKPAPTPPPFAEKLTLPGLPNFAQVNQTLFRGAQPKKNGYTELKKLGVEIVVSLREHADQISEERGAVEAQGMRFVSIPWRSFGPASNKQVAEFLELLRASPDKKVFVHCRRGAERTGVMLAAFRIAAQQWTPQQALDEMERFGFRGLFFRHLKKYVRSLPEQLEADPVFKPLAVPAK